MNETSSNPNIALLTKLSNLIMVAMAFLMPTFFLPTTTEFFEFNKLALLLLGTGLLIVLWVLRLVAGEKISIVRSPLDLPFVGFAIVGILASIFSVNKDTSIFGVQGRWFPSLFSMLTLGAYYYALSANLLDKKAIRGMLTAFVAGITVSSIVALLSYFKIYIGSAPYMRTMSFTLTGSITTAVVLASIATLLSLTMYLNEKTPAKTLFFGMSSIVNFFLVVLTGILPGWLPMVVGLVGMAYFGVFSKVAGKKTQSMALAGILVAILLVNILPTTKGLLKNEGYPLEVTLPLRESWMVATSTVQTYPLLATGPSTFHMNFTRFRPLALNNSDVWNVRFDKPHNEILNILSTMGIVGLVVALFVMTKLLKIVGASRVTRDDSGTAAAIGIATLALASVFFVTYATVLNTFVLVSLLGMLVAILSLPEFSRDEAERLVLSFASLTSISSIGNAGAIKKEYFQYILAAPILVGVILSGYLFYKVYAGEVYMRKAILALRANDGSGTYEYQGKAINISPNRDAYHTAYAQTNLALANALASKQELNDNERATIQQLVSQSIRSARAATELVNPLNVANWETRALIYRSIIGVADNAADWAIGAYNTAIQLDPSNPALRLDLGGIYYARGDYLSAANLFRQSTTLKADYANAHYNFGQALIKLNDIQNGKRELEAAQRLVPVNSPDHQKVTAEIEAINQQFPQVAGAASNKPSVEELEGNKEETAEPQEPLTNIGEEEVVENENLDLTQEAKETTQETKQAR